MEIDVKDLDCDFFAFSAHKLCGPTGVGILYGKYDLLQAMEPFMLGGGSNARFDMCGNILLKEAPYKFETGTPIIAEAIALGDACEYLTSIGFDNIAKIEHDVKEYALNKLKEISGIKIYNPTCETGIISFNIEGVHPHDAASVYDKNDVCIRAGHHCAQLITSWLDTIGTVRASFYFYNTLDDVKKFVSATKEASEFFNMF